MSGHWPVAPLPWQAELWQRLNAQIEADRLPHALMLTGREGIGKQWLLQALAARLLCRHPDAGTPCGTCKSCNLLAAGSHSDMMTLYPEEGSRQIKIDQVRALIDFAGRTASLGQRKVLLIGPAELMNSNAANALLKSLEEPSETTTLLLGCNDPSGLPATIRSRCQILLHATPGDSACLQWLEQRHGDAEAATQALTACPGQPLLAEALLQSDAVGTRQRAAQGLKAVLHGRLSALEYPGLVKDLSLEDALLLMQTGLEDALRERVAVGGTEAAGLYAAFALRDDLGRKRKAVLAGANPNRQLLIEDYAARLGEAFRIVRT